VVLVDDDAFVLEALKATLISWGLDVLAALSPEAAVDGLQRMDRRPDMIISDYRLRDGKVGTAAVKAIRDIVGADTPALIITGETGGDALGDAAAHRLPVLHKPVPPGTLRQEMARHIGVV
jgi:CheY-like chemotaxis protein